LERTNPAKVALREGFAAQVEASIAQLEEKIAGVSDAEEMARIQSEIASKKEWLGAIG
jgi:hypothetical protein